MTDVRKIILDRLRELNRSPITAAQNAGLERGFINDIVRGRKRSIKQEKIALVAQALDWTSSELAQKLGINLDPVQTQNPRAAPSFFDSASKIPVYASVEGGPGELVVSTEPIEWAVRPWYLREVKEGYAVVVVGESMSPAFEPGDLAIVNPKAPLVRGRVCIFVRREHEGDFTATIKRLVRQTPKEWIVEQFNPPEGAAKEFSLSRALYPEAFRVVGKYDGG